MAKYLTKEEERIILLKRIFPASYHGSENNILFEKCKAMGSSYCSSFNENGYNDKYMGFDSDKVYAEIGKLITDGGLLKIFEEHKEILHNYYNFYGKYYTYEGKENKLSIGSKWEIVGKETEKIINKYGSNAKAILRAVYEVNHIERETYKNYWLVKTSSANNGFQGKGWMTILSQFQLVRIIGNDVRSIEIPEEMIPLVEEILEG